MFHITLFILNIASFIALPKYNSFITIFFNSIFLSIVIFVTFVVTMVCLYYLFRIRYYYFQSSLFFYYFWLSFYHAWSSMSRSTSHYLFKLHARTKKTKTEISWFIFKFRTYLNILLFKFWKLSILIHLLKNIWLACRRHKVSLREGKLSHKFRANEIGFVIQW